jgi:hypothetical protein
MEKVDFKKEYKNLYQPSRTDFSLIKVPRFRYLMIDGKGNPNFSETYKRAIEALYSVSYVLKRTSKRDLDRDYVIPPLEGLWWADNLKAAMNGNKDLWSWTMMILLPDWISLRMVNKAIQFVSKKYANPEFIKLRVEKLKEGKAVQIMHVGPYEDEGPTLKKLHGDYMPAHGLTFNGKHHEIYLGDPRKTPPNKLRTVLRQPVRVA